MPEEATVLWIDALPARERLFADRAHHARLHRVAMREQETTGTRVMGFRSPCDTERPQAPLMVASLHARSTIRHMPREHTGRMHAPPG